MPIEFEPENVAPVVPAKPMRVQLGGGRRLGTVDRIAFTERLALLLDTGVPLHSALRSLHEQSDNPRMRALLGALADDIVAGARFSEALAPHGQLFPSTYVNLVGASEEGGFLPEVLTQLVEMDQKQEKLRSTIVSALSYPAFLVIFSVLVVLFILMFVFPKFAVMFAAIYDELPASTRLLMQLSVALTEHTVLVLGGACALLGALVAWALRPSSRAAIDRLKLRIPYLRGIFIKIYITRLMRVMGISLERGVTILDTLAACREVVPNLEFHQFIRHLEREVTEGKGIAAGFKDSGLIPISVQQMIATGEQAGSLGRVMGRVADFYDRELTRQLTQLSKLAEPVMLLVMGMMVGTIVSSLILPIFKLSRAAH